VLLAFGVLAIFISGSIPLTLLHLVPGIGLLVAAGVTSAADIRDRLSQDSSRRGLVFGSNALVQSLALAAVLGLVTYLVTRHSVQWDWTEAGVHSLSTATTDMLGKIPAEDAIEVYAFSLDARGSRDLLERYDYASDRFSFRIIDPNREIDKAQLFEVSEPVTVVCKGPCESEAGEKATATVKIAGNLSEEKVTESIRSLLSDKKKIYFLTGHEEGNPTDDGPEGMGLVRKALEGENISVATHVLASDPVVPEDADAFVVAGPTRALQDNELAALDAYLKGGGSVLVMIDPLTQSNLDATLQSWGIQVSADVIVDEQPQLFGAPQLVLQPVTEQYGQHPVTAEMTGRLTTFRLARSVEPAADAPEGQITKLVETSPNSYAAADLEGLEKKGELRLQPDKDRRGPISIAVARTFKKNQTTEDAVQAAAGIEPPSADEGRLIVIGDADFARNQGFTRGYNSDLVLNAANWLVGEEKFITIDRKLPRSSSVSMTPEQMYAFSFSAVFLLPELLVLLGIIQWWRRRR
jgi:ABC-type uncharacterized transport system involved in gliding motility auxiliary subunit